MKRSEILIPLSHDHHHGLVMALRMKKGGPASPHDRWPTDLHEQRERLIRFINNELLPHFEPEESLVFPATSSGSVDLRASTLTLQEQHEAMRMLIAQIQTADIEQLPVLMARFGAALEAHIRMEERIFFPQTEEAIAHGQLKLDAEALRNRHESYRQPPGCEVED